MAGLWTVYGVSVGGLWMIYGQSMHDLWTVYGGKTSTNVQDRGKPPLGERLSPHHEIWPTKLIKPGRASELAPNSGAWAEGRKDFATHISSMSMKM